MAADDTNDPGRPATIYEVAEAAGVSPSTVSRTFSRPGRVSVRTADHVREVATQLGYRVDGVFRPTSPQNNKLIALATADVTNPFYFGILRGAEWAAARAGYTLLLIDAQESETIERQNLSRVLPLVSGMVIASTRTSDTVLRSVSKSTPVVVLNRQVGGLACVIPDSPRGMRRAVEHLATLGHRHIYYLPGPEASWMNGIRWLAMREAAAELGLRETRLTAAIPTVEGGHHAADEVVSRGVKAVVCYNDVMAMGLMRGLKSQYGLQVAAVSNEGRELTTYRVQQFALAKFIDFFVSSCFVHFRKPDEDIFRMALDIAQVDLEQVVYIDNEPMFVEVARGLGISGIIHTGYDTTRKALEDMGLSLKT